MLNKIIKCVIKWMEKFYRKIIIYFRWMWIKDVYLLLFIINLIIERKEIIIGNGVLIRKNSY